jgi:hypothetical protein
VLIHQFIARTCSAADWEGEGRAVFKRWFIDIVGGGQDRETVLLEGVDACVRLFLEIGTTSGDGSERMKRLGSSTCCEKFGKQNC